MKPVSDLNLGYSDAEQYRKRENKQIFSQIFLQTPELDRLCDSSTSFLIGDKGTGKTAYAVFLSNMEYKNTVASHRYLRETEYKAFVNMKRQRQLTLTDYDGMWKVIIYLLLSQQIRDRYSRRSIPEIFSRFKHLNQAIDEFYMNAFSPEIVHAIEFADKAEISAELIAKFVSAGAKETSEVTFSKSKYQLNLLYISKQFEQALKTLKLDRDHILFIDGIDIRPQSIPYDTYLECIKGLANAVWSVNNDFFANIKDSEGRLRVVLLLRPDIFASLGLQNQNSKIRDNSVVLNWITTYTEYRTSPLFLLTDRMLAFQQEENLSEGEAWDYYFPYDTHNVRSPQTSPSSFISFMRYSLYRPRDILTILAIQQENYIEQRRGGSDLFTYRDFTNPAFTRKYSDYLLGEIRDHLYFYYGRKEYEILLKFFQFLNGRSRFSYDKFLSAFSRYVDFMDRNEIQAPSFCRTPDIFLQFLYDLNVIAFIVDTDTTPFFGYCFRERTPSNLAPKVRTGVRYDVHYGLMKALDLGEKFNIQADES